jgi:hypothetical protein
VTVDRGNRSCVTGLFLGGVPLSAPYGFGLADPPTPFLEAKTIGNAPGICLTLRSFVPAYRGIAGRPDNSNPACRSMNVRPGVFLRGIDRQI